jgi:acyl transferase domain-containing protein/acyl carrier protein
VSDPTESDLRDLLTSRLAARLRLDPAELDRRERFSRYGLDSAGATALIAELSATLGRDLSPTLIWAHPSVEELARHLSGAGSGEVVPASVPVPRTSSHSLDMEPIAIVGVACRFPGSPDWPAFWRLLRDGVDATGTVPSDRWDAEAWYDPDPQAPGKINTRRGAFLDRVDQFDPLFFGISPREACEMDPQQRLMLELSWEALEDAGIPPRSLAGSKTGVFVGAIGHDYGELHRLSGATVTSHTGPGTNLAIIANRVSYLLGLRGPSLTVDTACSASLVSVHLACQSLRSGECAVALAGGINMILAPGFTVDLTKFGGLSGDGRCKAFDARADGFARGEGGGVVVLKPLSRALADGDPVWCLIRGGAVNNDGSSNGLTAPSPQAQVEVLTDAYARTGVDPRRVHYVEAHGTGTRLGDPIEARSLAAVLCAGRDPERPLVVGSAKTNIAHQEGAAGIAGLIKLALAIRHRQVPPSLHFETPNPDIPFEELRLRVQTALGPWPAPPDEPAVGAVSSFGWGGTNCHLILEELPASRAEILLLEGGSEEEVRERFQGNAAAGPGAEASFRLAVSVRAPEELPERLAAFLAGQARAGLFTGRGERHGLVFVFSGMGSMWTGLGRDLLRAEPLVRARLEQCDRLLRPWVGWSLLDELVAGDRWLLAEVSIPAIFAIQAALSDLWRSWGIEPDAVIGHSCGEVAAAYAAGVLSLEEGIRVSVVYGRTLGKVDGPGGIGVLELPPDEAAARIAARGLPLELAGRLSPSSTTVAGPGGAVDLLVAEVKAEGRFAARVAVDAAAHTAAVEPHLPSMREQLADLAPRRPSVPLVSTLTGGPLDRPMDGDYWAANLRHTVLFSDGVEHLLGAGFDLFLQIDPHPILATPLEQSFAGRGRALASLRRREDPRSVLFDSLGALWAAGRPVREEAIHPDPRSERSEGSVELLPLSARTPEALRALARSTAGVLREEADGTHRDVCRQAARGRGRHEHGLGLTGRSRAELAGKLEAFARGEMVPGAVSGRRPRGDRGKLVFVFAGQGPQWPGMGRQLLADEPVFRQAFERCDDLLRPYLGDSLLRRIEREGALDHTEVAQPALFALEVALAALWRSWGIVPDAVVGHSVGEIAAAWAAGILSLEEAARVAALRGRAMEPARGRGAMAAVELSEDEARASLSQIPEELLCIAAVNGPAAVTVAGDPAAMDGFVARLAAQGATARRLRVEYAFHSPQMEPYGREVEEALAGLRPRPALIPMASTVTGALVEGPELDGSYWRRNVRQPVRFADAVGVLARHASFLEVGPHPVLSAAVSQGLEARGREAALLASLRRGRDERETMREALAGLWVLGHPVEWSAVFPDGGRPVRLPTYPFQRQRYWFEVPEREERREPAAAPTPVPASVEVSAPVAAPVPVPFEVLPEPSPAGEGVELLLAEQLDAFNRMVALQLDVLSRAGSEHL